MLLVFFMTLGVPIGTMALAKGILDTQKGQMGESEIAGIQIQWLRFSRTMSCLACIYKKNNILQNSLNFKLNAVYVACVVRFQLLQLSKTNSVALFSQPPNILYMGKQYRRLKFHNEPPFELKLCISLLWRWKTAVP